MQKRSGHEGQHLMSSWHLLAAWKGRVSFCSYFGGGGGSFVCFLFSSIVATGRCNITYTDWTGPVYIKMKAERWMGMIWEELGTSNYNENTIYRILKLTEICFQKTEIKW